MNILAPIDSIKEAKLLINAGATELFCGFVNKKWVDKFGLQKNNILGNDIMNVSINKRTPLNSSISDEEELVEILKNTKIKGVKLFVTLNAFYYPEFTYEYLDLHLEILYRIDVDGVIVTDVGVVQYIKNKFPNMYVVLSCCNQVTNSYSAKFFKSLGVDRITFPRHIDVEEMLEVSSSISDIEYEYFVLDERCIYDDGNCKPLHNLGHFCMQRWEYEYFACEKGLDENYENIKSLRMNECEYIQWSKPYISSDTICNGWRGMSCSACTVPIVLKRNNITSLKIAGRGLNIHTKIMMIRMVKKIIYLAKEENAIELEKEYIKNIFGIPEMCDMKERCLNPFNELKFNTVIK